MHTTDSEEGGLSVRRAAVTGQPSARPGAATEGRAVVPHGAHVGQPHAVENGAELPTWQEVPFQSLLLYEKQAEKRVALCSKDLSAYLCINLCISISISIYVYVYVYVYIYLNLCIYISTPISIHI
jgi:hypothetical protein